jgi:hypothetical protein
MREPGEDGVRRDKPVGTMGRFYYTELVAPDIVVVSDGIVTMEAWRVKAISEDRLSS